MKRRLPENFTALNQFFFTKSGPVVSILAIVIFVCAAVYYGASTWAVCLAVAIVSLRSMSEWMLHKFIWHRRALTVMGRKYSNPIAKMHAEHHRNPYHLDGLFFGPKAIVVLSALSALLGGMIFGLGNTSIMLVAWLVSLLLHEWFHLLAHSRVQPKSQYLCSVIAHHRHHHYKNANSCFCVSQVWADKVLGSDQF